MLFGERKRLEKIARAEAAGESFWTGKFDEPVRVKFIHLFTDATDEREIFYVIARGLIVRSIGKIYLDHKDWDARNDLLHYLMKCRDEEVPTVIEAMYASFGHPMARQIVIHPNMLLYFQVEVNRLLREHRISYKFVDSQMVEFAETELHEAVVMPTLRLLAGRPDLQKVESCYRKSLEEISKGDPADAITDAGTALQEMFWALGCEGNALGRLIGSAKDKGLLASHDPPMLNSVDKVMSWVAADRSETGDSHKASSASIDDAWFIVHVVGAIILRLSSATTRGR